MKLLQYVGPFSKNQTITIPARTDYVYTHIGIQIPKRQPIGAVPETSLPLSTHPVDVRINNIDYRVSHGLLEFDGLASLRWEIEFLEAMPDGTIIDILYNDSATI